ncbi:homoserine dehydrogenase [Haloarcula hispanica N601]|uniref:homoserine dehydrogenase n=3 Tax=Haloarcula hispanica TaxID=51589 RepID=V5TQD5_HALHI|nr:MULTISPECIES: homoserine dehydrogenase [Haloarcula]AEM58421.1 homoserine dehydrogenase [Haloarcula hispanica ATCC 33960]AHB67147.1 homoserine dehydrogenase [Haloarcula hispanica N601]AJF25418.1 homoserine dehydrogenase [Haloarcula sp. CBA1115]KAA9405939.1 homoserine dehydrogenase [Haloarcula sp. CBA1131]MCJ0620129.1 homoserine dehydrogenase [Haloarcula hispanica]
MRLAVIGAGAVGSSVVELASDHGHSVTAFADSSSAVIDSAGIDTAEVLDRKRTDGVVGSAAPEDALSAEYDVLVEATPTTLGDAEPGFSHVQAALERDRHAVLANKGPVAERYADVRALERESEGSVLFEATVGGAMPVLSTIDDFDPSHITAVRGVLNGTANFILSRMATEGLDYEHVLAEAQDLGVAEADPTFDVDGTDAALKGVIVANVLADDETEYTLDDAEVEGIQDISGSALELARADGRTVRLIAEVVEGSVRVGPRLVPDNAPLAVSGTRNIAQLETEHAGQLNISGRGAGGPETASAVLADIGRL